MNTRTKVFSALFSADNKDNNLLFLALSKEKLEADILAHVRVFQEQNEVGEKSNTYEDACNVLCGVLGASLDESEHILP